MTRKDFCLIAAALAGGAPAPHWDANKHAQHGVACRRMADALATTNPAFDRARFLAAAGYDAARMD